jgi:hypothetical protein
MMAGTYTSASTLFVLGGLMADPSSTPMFLSANNTWEGSVDSFAAAWLTNRAFCVTMRSSIVSLDFDRDDLEDLPRALEVVRESGLPWLEIASSGRGTSNRHIYINSGGDAAARQLDASLSSFCKPKVIRTGQPMRPPGVRHRRNHATATPVNSDQATSFLAEIRPDVSELLAELQPSTRQLIAAGPGDDRSAWDHKVTWQLVFDGLADAEIVLLALSRGTPFSEKARQRSGDDGLNYLLGGVAKVRKQMADRGLIPQRLVRSRADVDDLLARYRAEVERRPPDDYGGLTDRRVLLACLDLFAELHTLKRGLACRDVALAAGIGRTTAGKALRRLRAAGALKLVDPARGLEGLSARYQLTVPLVRTGLEAPGWCAGPVPPSAETRLPVFRHRFLSESGRTIWNHLLLDREIQRKELLQLTELKASTLDQAMARLIRYGAAEKTRQGWYKKCDVDLEEIGELYGADPIAKRQQYKVAEERQGFGEFRAERLGVLAPGLEVVDSNRVVDVATGEFLDIASLAERAATEISVLTPPSNGPTTISMGGTT